MVSNLLTRSDLKSLLSKLREAGELCLEMRDSERLEQRTKPDKSPVTRADLAANAILTTCLNSISFKVPILSEESHTVAFSPHTCYWLIDPLDGTKDFISGAKGFTLNVGLVMAGIPVFGAVYAPAFDFMAWTGKAGLETTGIIGLSESEKCGPFMEETIVASKSHMDEKTKAFLAKFPSSNTVQIGSSLKVLLLAIGAAEIYPRFAPTMPWDVAAADACLRSAGGGLFGGNGELLEYSSPLETNPEFLGLSSSMMSRRRELISAMNDVCA